MHELLPSCAVGVTDAGRINNPSKCAITPCHLRLHGGSGTDSDGSDMSEIIVGSHQVDTMPLNTQMDPSRKRAYSSTQSPKLVSALAQSLALQADSDPYVVKEPEVRRPILLDIVTPTSSKKVVEDVDDFLDFIFSKDSKGKGKLDDAPSRPHVLSIDSAVPEFDRKKHKGDVNAVSVNDRQHKADIKAVSVSDDGTQPPKAPFAANIPENDNLRVFISNAVKSDPLTALMSGSHTRSAKPPSGHVASQHRTTTRSETQSSEPLITPMLAEHIPPEKSPRPVTIKLKSFDSDFCYGILLLTRIRCQVYSFVNGAERYD
jgi:hypothetical protein